MNQTIQVRDTFIKTKCNTATCQVINFPSNEELNISRSFGNGCETDVVIWNKNPTNTCLATLLKYIPRYYL